MLIERRTAKARLRFFDRFDEEARRFEDRLRAGASPVESIPWPRVSFWQGYRHLESTSKRFYVLQMLRSDSDRAYQIAVVEGASRIPWFKTGAVPYWIPLPEPGALPEQA
jgi:hypothetical protein